MWAPVRLYQNNLGTTLLKLHDSGLISATTSRNWIQIRVCASTSRIILALSITMCLHLNLGGVRREL